MSYPSRRGCCYSDEPVAESQIRTLPKLADDAFEVVSKWDNPTTPRPAIDQEEPFEVRAARVILAAKRMPSPEGLLLQAIEDINPVIELMTQLGMSQVACRLQLSTKYVKDVADFLSTI